MKTHFLFKLFLLISLSSFSQQKAPSTIPEKIMVSGTFNSENRVVRLSQQTHRLLFIKTNGNLVLPEYGYFLKVSKSSSSKIATGSYIVIIPLNGLDNDYSGEDNEAKNIEVFQLTPDDSFVFYTNNTADSQNEFRKNFFQNPSLKDTVNYSNLTEYHSLTNIKAWIDNLSNLQKVTVQGTRYAEYTDGRCEASTVYSAQSMSELAKKKLHYVANLFREIDEEKWTKQQWQNWFNNIINFKPPTCDECNKNNWNIKINFKEGYENSAVFATDAASKNVYRIEQVPNYEEFKDQQLLIFDMAKQKYFNYDIYSKDRPLAISFHMMDTDSNKLYLLTEYFEWYKYSYNKQTDKYSIAGQKSILPATFFKKWKWHPIGQCYSNNKKMFFTFQSQDDKEIFLVSFDSRTGGSVVIKPLRDLLKNSGLNYSNKLTFIGLSYADNSNDDFIFALQDKENYYVLKTDESLTNLKLIKATKEIGYCTVVTIGNEIQFLHSWQGVLNVSRFDKDLNQQLGKSSREVFKDYDDENGLICKDGDNLVVFKSFMSEFNAGIKKFTLDKSFKIIDEKCVYSYVPVDEITSENVLHLHYTSKLNNNEWLIFFRNDDVLRYSTAK